MANTYEHPYTHTHTRAHTQKKNPSKTQQIIRANLLMNSCKIRSRRRVCWKMKVKVDLEMRLKRVLKTKVKVGLRANGMQKICLFEKDKGNESKKRNEIEKKENHKRIGNKKEKKRKENYKMTQLGREVK